MRTIARPRPRTASGSAMSGMTTGSDRREGFTHLDATRVRPPRPGRPRSPRRLEPASTALATSSLTTTCTDQSSVSANSSGASQPVTARRTAGCASRWAGTRMSSASSGCGSGDWGGLRLRARMHTSSSRTNPSRTDSVSASQSLVRSSHSAEWRRSHTSTMPSSSELAAALDQAVGVEHHDRTLVDLHLAGRVRRRPGAIRAAGRPARPPRPPRVRRCSGSGSGWPARHHCNRPEAGS